MEFEWYTNKKKNLKIYAGNDCIPAGFSKGFTLLESTKIKKIKEKNHRLNKELKNKDELKQLKIQDRLSIKRKILLENNFEKNLKKYTKSLRLNSLNIEIKRELNSNKDYLLIYEENKFSKDDSFYPNKLLKDYILEKELLHQLEEMPIYIDTIIDSLKSLYSKNRLLQNKKSIDDYFYSSIKKDAGAISQIFGEEYLNLLD